MNFIVVKVETDYDYVEDVFYVEKFKTKEEAVKFISDRKEKQNSDWSARCKYVEQWVDAIELPETDYNGWKEFLKTWNAFCHPDRYIRRKDFKNQFKDYLMKYSFKFEGYNPPEVNFNSNNLFIIEVKD